MGGRRGRSFSLSVLFRREPWQIGEWDPQLFGLGVDVCHKVEDQG